MSRLPRPPIKITAKLRARFMRHVRIAETGCWEWQGRCNAKGYGHFDVGIEPYMAHRVSYEMAKGVSPGRLLVCHSCDNPRCVNPEHLWLGTAQDNINDMYAKGCDYFAKRQANAGASA